MAKLLWKPSAEYKRNTNMMKFTEFVNKRHGKNFRDYDGLYQWSIEDIPDFWVAMWDFADIKASKRWNRVVDDATKMPGAKWFSGAKLNYAENLLRHRDNRIAIISKKETLPSVKMTYAELYDAVARLAKSLREIGVVPGDRVVAYSPNIMETAIAMLAATSIGAIWASAATDTGLDAALDRFGQIGPKVLFTSDEYFYKGKTFNTMANLERIVKGVPSIEKVIVASYLGNRVDISGVPNSVYFDDFLAKEKGLKIKFEQVPFEQPLYIMFTSGTTGKPKCLVQGVGGILISHLKDLLLFTDLKPDDIHYYVTTCSWMMWNWLLTSLAVGAKVVLYDGNIMHPDWGVIWKMIQDERVTIFGTSASYINLLKSQGVHPGKEYDLSSLREISQTGSALSAEGFEWIYQEVKKDLYFNSMSGGTDINAVFIGGNPISPVYAGEIAAPTLAMKVKAYDEKGNSVIGTQGELVCEAPAPSMPLYFWNDPDGKRYQDAYFNVYPGVWQHGDYILIHRDTRGTTFYGRSDSVLMPSGVRIGTAEIYNQVDKLEEVEDSLAIGQDWQGDQRIILFVKLAPGYQLTDDLKNKIRKTLRENTSPRHVPAKIIKVPEIPYTLNMKKVESAVTNLMHGKPVLNRDALVNPKSLDYFENLEELKT